jgi:hypothetical protein
MVSDDWDVAMTSAEAEAARADGVQPVAPFGMADLPQLR